MQCTIEKFLVCKKTVTKFMFSINFHLFSFFSLSFCMFTFKKTSDDVYPDQKGTTLNYTQTNARLLLKCIYVLFGMVIRLKLQKLVFRCCCCFCWLWHIKVFLTVAIFGHTSIRTHFYLKGAFICKEVPFLSE